MVTATGNGQSFEKQIDFDRYVPVVLSSFVDKLRASSTIFFRKGFELSILEWRILAFVSNFGSCSAYRIRKALHADKAAVSRAVKRLSDKRLLSIREIPGGRTKTAIEVTEQGQSLYDSTVDVIVARHQRLVGELTDNEIDVLLRTVRYLESRIPMMAESRDESG
jgi:DNA-binding MarR family transcriptional regulator